MSHILVVVLFAPVIECISGQVTLVFAPMQAQAWWPRLVYGLLIFVESAGMGNTVNTTASFTTWELQTCLCDIGMLIRCVGVMLTSLPKLPLEKEFPEPAPHICLIK